MSIEMEIFAFCKLSFLWVTIRRPVVPVAGKVVYPLDELTTLTTATFILSFYQEQTCKLDPSGGFVSPGPNLTGGMEPGVTTNIQTE